MDKQKQIEEMAKILQRLYNTYGQFNAVWFAEHLAVNNIGKIPEGAVVLTDDELNEVIDTCKVSMIITDDDGEKYISLDDHNEYTGRLGKIVRQRKARIEYLEKLLDDRCDRCIERVRKETAENFAERLKEMAYQSVDWSHGEHPMVVEVDYIDEICKEITEGKDGT